MSAKRLLKMLTIIFGMVVLVLLGQIAFRKSQDTPPAEDKRYAYLPSSSVYFYDVNEQYSWAFREIDALALHGIIGGADQGLFQPDAPIKRADFMLMLDRAYGMSDAVKSGLVAERGSFTDVPEDAYFADSIKAAYALNIAQGNDGLFRPNDTITKQEVAVFLKRTLDMTEIDLPKGRAGDIEDADKIADYAKTAVLSLLQANVISVDQKGRLSPEEQVTRAQMAVMIYRSARIEQGEGEPQYHNKPECINLCIGNKVYNDVVIENYDAAGTYRELMRYTDFRQTETGSFITLHEAQPIDRQASYENGRLQMEDGSSVEVAEQCISVEVDAPYHSLSAPKSTGKTYAGCMPVVANGQAQIIYYKKAEEE